MEHSTATSPTLLTETEAAEILGCKVSTLRQWRLRRRGPAFHKIGGLVRYDRGELLAFIESCKVPTRTGDGTGRRTAGRKGRRHA